MTLFLRLLRAPIEAKGATLAAQIAALNSGQPAPDTFSIAPADFNQIPGSPFAYWTPKTVLQLFSELEPLEHNQREARIGPSTGDDARYVRLVWEVLPNTIGRATRWAWLNKGGTTATFYFSYHLVIDWDDDRKTFRDFYGRLGRMIARPNGLEHFFRPGISWPLRTQSGFHTRAMPGQFIFTHKGPTVFHSNERHLLTILAITNSSAFAGLIRLSTSFGSYEVGAIQRTPIPDLETAPESLSALALEAHDLTRNFDRTNEVTHAFRLPALALRRTATLQAAAQELRAEHETARARLSAIQAEIDEIVAGLYGLTEADLTSVGADVPVRPASLATEPELEDESVAEEESDDAEIEEVKEDLQTEVENLLLWCVGVAFGRWDVRMALDPTLLPKLQGPFEPLPVCPPGMLVGPDGLPATRDNLVSEEWLRARPNVITLPDPSTLHAPLSTPSYPLPLPWYGIVPDDDQHKEDLVARVEQVLELLWGERAEAIQREACNLLGVASLREYFRHPKLFFDFHIKRYSKSRRKAPIYWLLQSSKKNYGVWIYYHRMDRDTLYKALSDYALPKTRVEGIRLDDLRRQLTPDLPARDRRALEKAIARQEAFIAELNEFCVELERIARLDLFPDFNDGVLINIAPAHTLVPWKEAERMWDELTRGKYEWSTMSKRMREKGLMRPASKRPGGL